MNLDTEPRSPGYIYLIKAISWEAKVEYPLYKIGLSKHPMTRLEELQRGAAPFVALELVFSLPVSSMFDVEQKLHILFDDKRIHNEWFLLEEHDIEAVRSLAGQVSDIVRKRRRALEGVEFYVPSKALQTEIEQEQKTELESLILMYIPHRGNKVSQKCKRLLNTQVILAGQTFESPEELWATMPAFHVWAEKRLKDLSVKPQMNMEWAINSLRLYDIKYIWAKDNTKAELTVINFGD